MVNSPTISEINNGAWKISVNPLPEKLPTTLELLTPWDIPLECSICEPLKQQIFASMKQLLQALQIEDFSQALIEIAQILHNLDIPETQLAKIDSTKTALRSDEVDDYDQYFKVNHVQAQQNEDIALCLVRGLLTNCYTFTALCCQASPLNSRHIAQQKQGFISYILLLSRVFDLEDFNINNFDIKDSSTEDTRSESFDSENFGSENFGSEDLS
jgi:hypothetical protein